MNKPQITVGKYQGYTIYAEKHPVSNQLFNFTTGGTDEVFSNYLNVEKYINFKTKGRVKETS